MDNRDINNLFFALVNNFQVTNEEPSYLCSADSTQLFGDVAAEEEYINPSNTLMVHQEDNLNDALNKIVNSDVQVIVPVNMNKIKPQKTISKQRGFGKGLTAKQRAELANESREHKYRKTEEWQKATNHFVLNDGKMMYAKT